jgi:hypothetical protein
VSESHEDKPFAAASRPTAKGGVRLHKNDRRSRLHPVDAVQSRNASSAAATKGLTGLRRAKSGAGGLHDRRSYPKLAS